ncbi:hypothetical protein U0R22_003735 [Mesorhizobium huakuii]|uniref:Uncharacterized protein n=1 Tax=Mesorhizobium huakuii TaxID=28104 RepID=A0ABZ0VRH5_9HYPH|nr:hypothetical protein [Mesorhizobium huakuii]WQB99552.1 hypothetical protein U0R22_003735 [Mesorhizobium huakuii]
MRRIVVGMASADVPRAVAVIEPRLICVEARRPSVVKVASVVEDGLASAAAPPFSAEPSVCRSRPLKII